MIFLSFRFSLTRYESPQEEVSIGLVGKYTKYEDTYTSVVKALRHASLQCRRKLKLTVNRHIENLSFVPFMPVFVCSIQKLWY